MQSQNNPRILQCENVLSGLERSCGEMCQKTCSNAVGGLINLLTCAFWIQGIPESSLPSTYTCMFDALIDFVMYIVLSKSVLMQSNNSWRMSVFLFWRLSMSSSLIPELGGRERQ